MDSVGERTLSSLSLAVPPFPSARDGNLWMRSLMSERPMIDIYRGSSSCCSCCGVQTSLRGRVKKGLIAQSRRREQQDGLPNCRKCRSREDLYLGNTAKAQNLLPPYACCRCDVALHGSQPYPRSPDIEFRLVRRNTRCAPGCHKPFILVT